MSVDIQEDPQVTFTFMAELDGMSTSLEDIAAGRNPPQAAVV